MADSNETYNSEFKKEVAKKALSRNKKNLEPLSEEYDVPTSLILTWAVQLEEDETAFDQSTDNGSSEGAENETVDLEINSHEIQESVTQGVMSDDLNYRRLVSWTIVGVVIVAIFAQMLIESYTLGKSVMPEQIAGEHAFYQVTRKKNQAQQQLSSFGVVDKKKGIYRVPIEMAIEKMAQKAATDTTDSTKKELLDKKDPTPVESN